MGLYIAFGVAWIIVFYIVWSKRHLEKLKIEKGRFENPFLDGMHRYGFIFPLRHFVDDDEDLTKKGELIKERLKYSGLHKKFSVRSYMGLSFIVLVASLLTGALFVYLLQFTSQGAELILGIEVEQQNSGLDIQGTTLIMMIFLLIALVPNLYLKQRAKKQIAANAKELPMLQMFVILMLKSNKTVAEILHALTKLHSNHKEVFLHGYRIYLRNPAEAMEYYRSSFGESRFSDMFDLLEDVSQYGKKESIAILESTMKSLVDETNDIRRKNDLTQLVYSQASMVAPYAAFILLGVSPLIIMAIDLFSSSMEI